MVHGPSSQWAPSCLRPLQLFVSLHAAQPPAQRCFSVGYASSCAAQPALPLIPVHTPAITALGSCSQRSSCSSYFHAQLISDTQPQISKPLQWQSHSAIWAPCGTLHYQLQHGKLANSPASPACTRIRENEIMSGSHSLSVSIPQPYQSIAPSHHHQNSWPVATLLGPSHPGSALKIAPKGKIALPPQHILSEGRPRAFPSASVPYCPHTHYFNCLDPG